MPRIPKLFIIRPCLVFSDDEIRTIKFNESYFDDKLSSNEYILKFSARMRIIANERFCNVCSSKMSLVKRKRKFLEHSSRCIDRNCNNEISLADLTYFFSTNLHLKKIIKILYKFSRSSNYDVISYELNLDLKTVSF